MDYYTDGSMNKNMVGFLQGNMTKINSTERVVVSLEVRFGSTNIDQAIKNAISDPNSDAGVYFNHGLRLNSTFGNKKVLENLEKLEPKLKEMGLRLVIVDMYRPYQVQINLFERLPDPLYSMDPKIGYSHHVRGVALDCRIEKENGEKIILPPTPSECLKNLGGTSLAECIAKDKQKADKEFEKFHSGYVFENPTEDEKQAMANGKLLKDLMTSVGFEYYPFEWWHFQLPNPQTYPGVDTRIN